MSDIEKQIESMAEKAVAKAAAKTQQSCSKVATATKEKKKTQTGDDFWTFSSIATALILVWSVGCVSLSYMFGWFARENVLEDLSERHLIVIVGVFFASSVKSFLETKAQENVKLEYAKLEAKTVEMADGSPTVEENVAG